MPKHRSMPTNTHYLSRLEQLAWDTSHALSAEEMQMLFQARNEYVTQTINPDISVVLLESWSNSVSARKISDISDKDMRTYSSGNGLELHLALQYENNHPGMFKHTNVPQLSVLRQILEVMNRQNIEKMQRVERDDVAAFVPLYAAFTFSRKFNPEKGYLLCLAAADEEHISSISQMLSWEDWAYKTHYLDTDTCAIVDERNEMRCPDLSLPVVAGQRIEFVQRSITDYKSASNLFFYAVQEALSHLDFVFSSYEENYVLRYNSVLLVYCHNGTQRTMRLFFSQDKKKVWLTGYVPNEIAEKL